MSLLWQFVDWAHVCIFDCGRSWNVYQGLEDRIKNFQVSLPLITLLRRCPELLVVFGHPHLPGLFLCPSCCGGGTDVIDEHESTPPLSVAAPPCGLATGMRLWKLLGSNLY